jgi:hypothetical protein
VNDERNALERGENGERAMNKDHIEDLLKTTSGKPDFVAARIVRPRRDAELIKDSVGIEGVIAQTRGDIDHGAGGHVMLDRDFKPTGEPPPDPSGAYCMLCKKRIWAHGDDTAFPIMISSYGDWRQIGGGACCEKCSALDDEELMRKLYPI